MTQSELETIQSCIQNERIRLRSEIRSKPELASRLAELERAAEIWQTIIKHRVQIADLVIKLEVSE